MTQEVSALVTYLQLVTEGYRAAGYTKDDVAAFGGLMKLQGYLHMLAANDFIDECGGDLYKAKLAVTKFVEETVRKDENNNFDYSGT